MSITFFDTPQAFHDWLATHHAASTELTLGFYKTHTKRAGITYAEALDEALCYGWIDGVRKRIDDESFSIRFTPRKSGSIWSLVNVRKVEVLLAAGRMQPAGLKAFAARDEKKTGIYSFEGAARGLDAPAEAEFRMHEAAWSFYEKQAPSYRRAAEWWVVGAKKEETRAKRLAQLIADSERGLRLAHLVSPGTKRKA